MIKNGEYRYITIKNYSNFLCYLVRKQGLSWHTVLKKRKNYRKAFDNFEAKKIALYKERKISELLANEGIIRNKVKINAAVHNVKLFVALQNEFGCFDNYIWKFTNYKPLINHPKTMKDIPIN